MLRFHTQTGGATLTAQQPRNNIVRTALEALAAVLGGTQSLHTNSFDEALALPTEQAAKIALRTQQVIGHETGVTHTVDPLGGSYYVESLTNEVEARAWEYLERIDRMGGAVEAIEAGFYQDEIAEAAYRIQQGIESGERVIVGVNGFEDAEEQPVQIQTIGREEVAGQVERLRALRASRDQRSGGPGARRDRGDRPRDRQPAPADEGRPARAGDPRRGLRRAARRVRRVPPPLRLAGRSRGELDDRVHDRRDAGDAEDEREPPQARAARRRDGGDQAAEPDQELGDVGQGLAHRGAG